MKYQLAIILPCFNEEVSIKRTIEGFKRVLPDSQIIVCDNSSTDRTAEIAVSAGARVLREKRRGKGFAVRRLFEDVEADVYLMADGDLTYDPDIAPEMVAKVLDGSDMVVGRRVEDSTLAYRPGHRFGNRLFNRFLFFLFQSDLTDIFSGYRAFSRRFVKSFPVDSKGFEIETEISVHCLCLRLDYLEIPCKYSARAEDSFSKLNKYRDGFKIIWKMIKLYVEYKPLQFFSIWAFIFFLLGAGLFARAFEDFLSQGLVPRFPSLIVSMMFFGLTAMCLVFGVVLHYLQKMRIEQKRLFYLSIR